MRVLHAPTRRRPSRSGRNGAPTTAVSAMHAVVSTATGSYLIISWHPLVNRKPQEPGGVLRPAQCGQAVQPMGPCIEIHSPGAHEGNAGEGRDRCEALLRDRE